MMKIVFHGGPMHGARWVHRRGPFAPRGELWIGADRYQLATPPVLTSYGELLLLEHISA